MPWPASARFSLSVGEDCTGHLGTNVDLISALVKVTDEQWVCQILGVLKDAMRREPAPQLFVLLCTVSGDATAPMPSCASCSSS